MRTVHPLARLACLAPAFLMYLTLGVLLLVLSGCGGGGSSAMPAQALALK